MVDRIATSTVYQSALSELLNAETRASTAQQQVSSGDIANDYSGFGATSQAIIAAQSVKTRVDGLVSQLNTTSTALTFQQTALAQVSSAASSLQLAVTTAMGTSTGDDLMSQVQSLFNQTVSALNTQYNGSYVFSGGQTTTQPFTATQLSDLTTQSNTSSFFQNGSIAQVARTDDNATTQTGFLATDVGKSLMDVFQSIEAFQQGSTGSFGGTLTAAQQTFLTNALTQINAVVASTTQTTAQGGDIQNQIQTALTTQTDRQTTLSSVLDGMTQANMADAAAQLTQAQTAVQASAQVFNVLKGMSLLNYLTTSTGG